MILRPRRQGEGGARRPGWGHAGFSIVELFVVIGILSVVFSIAFLQWREYTEFQRVRYGTVQLATDVREALERAKAERAAYTVTLTAGLSSYAIVRTSGGFTENADLPDGVTALAAAPDWVVRISAFGKPVDSDGDPAGYTLSVQNAKGTGTITVTSAGGVSYQEP